MHEKYYDQKLLEQLKKALRKKFRYINMFFAIIDEVLVMPKIDHRDDTTFKSINKPRIIERIGWGTKNYEKKRKEHSNMKERKHGLMDEYLENLDTL